MRAVALDLRQRADPRLHVSLRQLTAALDSARGNGVRVGIGLGASLLAPSQRCPRQLKAMPVFAGDVLDPQYSHGDVLVQVAGSDTGEVREAAERVLQKASDWRMRWQIDGFRAENRADDGRGLARNPFGFTEGFGNPSSQREAAQRMLVRDDSSEPDWAVGGSYQVVRIIRFATELWDQDSLGEQERIIGRRRGGRWLDGTPPGEEPNFTADPHGKMTPLDAHVRMAAPDRRSPPPLVRRSYSYDRGNGDTGLIFSCFQRDLATGFAAVQKRLAGEALAQYVLTVGGGYFFVPPAGEAWLRELIR
ncbi:Dyp-type peroxidase [Streptomyces sp. H27-D2]|uniref:Dyp-type peroxidase n=1 Tax=Streptomyces sp. H27-D2 TaxID=3046304 RepID=UPI003FA7E01E